MGDTRDWTAAVWLAAAASVVRLVLAAVVPLVPDETYYWEWSRHLAAGYFDHPPGIALLIRAGTAVAGPTAFGVRFGVIVAGFLATLATLALARRLGGARAAWYAALVIVVMPMAGAGLLLTTPDVPMLLCVSAALWALDHALESDAIVWWIATGIAMGAALCSKYTAVLIAVAILLALALRPSLRPRLRRPGPYVAAVVMLLVFSPVIWWNETHQWVSFRFQLTHGLVPKGHSSVFQRELSLLGGQLALVTPILFAFLAAAVVRAVRRGTPDRVFVPAVVAAFIALFFVWSAVRHSVEPNWLAPALLPSAVVFAVWPPRARLGRWEWGGIGLAAAVLLVIYVQGIAPVLPIKPKADPVARGAGWDELAHAVAVERGDSSAGVWVAADRYQDAAELAFHLPGHPPVFALNLSGRPNQYDLWPSFPDVARRGQAMVLVLDDNPGTPGAITALLPCFASVARGDVVELKRGGETVTRRRLWLLRGWLGSWPTPAGAPVAPVPNSGTVTLGGNSV